MRASLADQGGGSAALSGCSLAIALGANLPSPAGDPLDTLIAVRPLLSQQLGHWLSTEVRLAALSSTDLPPAARLRWSPLFATPPLGGPPAQPDYINAVLLAELPQGSSRCRPEGAAHALLERLQALEQCFGRERHGHWAPRSLDLDLLWIGVTRLQDPLLQLPHPRLLERAFVLAPLAAIDPELSLAAVDPLGRPAATLLANVLAADPSQRVRTLPARPGWPEG